MKRDVLNTTIAATMTGLGFVKSMICQDSQGNWAYQDKGWCMVPESDAVTSQETEQASFIEETWEIRMCFFSAPEMFQERAETCGTAKDAVRAAIVAYSASTLASLADTTDKVHSLNVGGMRRVSRDEDELDGLLIVGIPITIKYYR